MRLSSEQISTIRKLTSHIAGASARVWLFGSRVRDDLRGGDVDLLIALDSEVLEPAQLSARLAARVSRSMSGRRVDVLVRAPNLMHFPIHDVALAEGVLL